MRCKLCGADKADDKRSDLCRACSKTHFMDEKYLSKDTIIVEHKAGNRKSQKVRKFKSVCPHCGKDKGYVFKKFINYKCGSCAKLLSVNKPVPAHNFYGHRQRKYTPHQGRIWTRSSYESFYIDYLNQKEIDFYYEPKRFPLSNKRTYLPDFYLPETDEYIELKGWERIEDLERIQQFRDDYPNIKLSVLNGKNLKKIGYDQKAYQNSYYIKINKDCWSVNVLTKEKFQKIIGYSTRAAVNVESKTFYFMERGAVDFQTIVHEVYHAYYSYLHTNSTIEPTKDDLEELNAEFIAEKIFKIFHTAWLISKNNLIVLYKKNPNKVTNFGLDLKDLENIVKFTNKVNRATYNPIAVIALGEQYYDIVDKKLNGVKKNAKSKK